MHIRWLPWLLQSCSMIPFKKCLQITAYFSKTGTGFFQLQLLVLIFALDRTNYARWPPVHIKDTRAKQWKSERFLWCSWLDRESGCLETMDDCWSWADKDSGWVWGDEQPVWGCFQSHEQGDATQETFHKQVNNMCDAIESMGNPFSRTAKELTS